MPESSLGFPAAAAVIFESKQNAARQRIPQLRELLQQTDSLAKNCADEMLGRFLECNITVKHGEVKSVGVKHAAEQLATTMRWRAELSLDAVPPSCCSCPTCDVDPYGHCLFSIGIDRRGWELAYSSPGRTTAKDFRSTEKHLKQMSGE